MIPNHSSEKRGMTLLELTVAILILLSLISILFIGARAWKMGSDRSMNIVNIRNVQQAARGYQYVNNLSQGEPLLKSSIIPGYIAEPKIPAHGLIYEYGNSVPEIGTLYLTVSGTNAARYAPAPESTENW